MPELLIMRHAKSDWGVGLADDRERPLAPRGVKAAKRVGKFLTKVNAAPDLILSSPAVRARTTAELANKAGRWAAPMEIVPSFYGGGWSDVVEGVLAAGESAERILVTGHEPTWSALVSVLTGGSLVAMPTAAIACIAVIGNSWVRLGPNCAELQWHVTPTMLKGLL
jgi:phosphohistidine phosphatase